MDQTLRRQFRKTLAQKQDTQNYIPAILGNGSGTVAVPGSTNKVYVRIADSVQEVTNNGAVPAINDYPVWIGTTPMQPDVRQVLGLRSGAVFSSEGAPDLNAVARHAASHRWLGSGANGGTDPVFIELRQFLPLRVGATTGLSINVYPGLLYLSGALVQVSTPTPIDLTSYVPLRSEGTGKGKFVLVYVDDSGTVAIADGTLKDVTALAAADIPAVPAGGTRLAAVRLYTGQTAIYEAKSNNDIIDLRFSSSLGDSGGGALADHDHSGDAGDGGTFDAANLTSGAAADGYVLTADGAGGAAWEATSAGIRIDSTFPILGGLLTAGARVGGFLDHLTTIGLGEVSNPVIACGSSAASDRYIREIGNVLYEPDESSRRYKLMYTGYNAGSYNDEKIHYAYSEDGKAWTKYASNPVIADRAEDPYLLKVNGVYYLYAENKVGTTLGSPEHIVRRWHSGDCMTWIDDGDITGMDQVTSPVVWVEGSTWYMLYERFPTTLHDVRLATSTDGLAWTNSLSNPVFEAADAAWVGVGQAVVSDDIVKINGVYYMTYHGYDGAAWGEGIAKSTNLTSWTDLGRFTDSSGSQVVTASIVYDTRMWFTYYIDDNSGVYRGFPLPPLLTESGGAVTISTDWVVIAAESGTTDDLTTINSGVMGQFLIVQADTGDTIAVKHGTGNIYLNGAADFTLTGNKTLLLFFDGAYWSDTGAGGSEAGAIKATDLATYFEPLVNGDTTTPELLFGDDGDILMGEVNN